VKRATWIIGALAVLSSARPAAVADETAPPSMVEVAVERPSGPALPERPWLQIRVDVTPPGGTLRLEPVVYSGPVLVDKPIHIVGAEDGETVISNGGTGTVMTLNTDDASLRGLTFRASGDVHSQDDACLNVRGDRNVVEGNRFEDCLFGIDLKQADENRVADNYITSKAADLGVRGDGIRLWYSMNNVIENNDLVDVRDSVVWYSNGNLFRRNRSRGGRYAIHFMYATANTVEENEFSDCSVGVYVMYTEGVMIRRNRISRSTGATGMGIGFKEASDTVLEDNTIVYCSIGVSSDLSPYQPGSQVEIRGNRIAYNGVGLTVVGRKLGTVVENNVFEGNIEQISQSGGGNTTVEYRSNYWDDYQGFDRDHDDVGDTPYELYASIDRIWMEFNYARFFKNSPVMEALDFLERLAPFTEPDVIARDERPVFIRPETTP
jgi:nitrous oxidase accessory protein